MVKPERGRSFNKRKPNWLTDWLNLHLRGDVTTPGAGLSPLSLRVPRAPGTYRAITARSVKDNSNVTVSMSPPAGYGCK